MDNQDESIAALIALHQGLDRQGPGDAEFTRHLLRQLPALPPNPRIADLGCGSGAAALLLAEHYQATVKAVDFSSEFIENLTVRAKRAGLEPLIMPIVGDMANLDWPPGSLDLLWSEGAAYNLGFETALHRWRPLLAPDGIAVISEMSWFTDAAPEPALAYWQNAYPQMGTEAENVAHAIRTGFKVLSTQRLPSQVWWMNYYGPLRQRMEQIERTTVMQSVIQETEAEIALFEQFSDFYGYTFYILQATAENNAP